MAYSNWGAFVYENGKRRRDKEDVGVFDTDEHTCPTGLRIFANIMKNNEKFPTDKAPWYTHSHHAVLGDNEVRLCGYKNWPELWICGAATPERVNLECFDEDTEASGEVEVNGKIWEYSFEIDDNMIDLKLIEPDATTWTARCGYLYGAGHMD